VYTCSAVEAVSLLRRSARALQGDHNYNLDLQSQAANTHRVSDRPAQVHVG